MWAVRCGRTGRGSRAPLPAAERLRHYAARCNAVEGNTTFYATPARETVAAWAGQTDPDFRFVVKLPRLITHERRLADADEPLRAFPGRDRAARPACPCALDPAAGIVRAGRRTRARPLPAPPVDRAPVRGGGTASGVLRRPARDAAAGGDARRRRRRVGAVRHDRLLPAPADQRRRTGRRGRKKPRVAPRSHALTDRPIVRYLGRDAVAETVDRAGSRGSPSSRTGCARAARPRSSYTPRTTPTR